MSHLSHDMHNSFNKDEISHVATSARTASDAVLRLLTAFPSLEPLEGRSQGEEEPWYTC